MRLATLREGGADGVLVVVSSNGKIGMKSSWFPQLLLALENWEVAELYLRSLADEVETGVGAGIVDLQDKQLAAPLPRTFSLLDGSAFIQHILLVRKARNAEPPEDLYTVPLIYQGVGDHLLGPTDDIVLPDEAYGLDYEAEFALVLGEVPMGTKAADAEKYIRLVLLMNDISYRNLIPRELAAGFGFFHGKPASSFSPFAVSLDELASSWRDGRLHMDLVSRVNGEKLGDPNGGEMHFSFLQLIEHAAKTRHLPAGTILGCGTVSNADASRGVSCLAEKRTRETIETGGPKTPFLKIGDMIEIEASPLFGKISQRVVA